MDIYHSTDVWLINTEDNKIESNSFLEWLLLRRTYIAIVNHKKWLMSTFSIEEKRNYNFMKFEFPVAEGIYGWYEKLIKQIWFILITSSLQEIEETQNIPNLKKTCTLFIQITESLLNFLTSSFSSFWFPTFFPAKTAALSLSFTYR